MKPVVQKPNCLYVARGSKGLLKVGRTTDLERRRHQLTNTFYRMGEALVRLDHTEFIVFTSPEQRLIKSVSAQGLEQVKGKEWFRGGDFDSIMQFAHLIQAEARDQGIAYAAKNADVLHGAIAKSLATRRANLVNAARHLLPIFESGAIYEYLPELIEHP